MLATCLVLAMLGRPAAPARGAKPEEDPEPKNGVSFKIAYMHTFNRARPSQDPDAEAPSDDDMGGFVLAYERVVLPEWLAVEFAKPFYFGVGRFDSPFEATLELFHRWRFVEPFLGVGLTFNVRVFGGEREEIEGERNNLSFGIVTTPGLRFWVAKRWSLELEGSYAYIPLGTVVEHELALALGPAFAF